MGKMTDDPEWETAKASIPVGTRVTGVVTHHCSYGLFIAIDSIPFPAHVDILAIKDTPGPISKEDYPPINSRIEAIVLGFSRHLKEIALGINPSLLAHFGTGGP